MQAVLDIDDLLEYTDWERQQWLEWFRLHGAAPLEISAGPHGDGRFGKVGELVRHMFSAEKRYVERLSGLALTDTAAIPTNDVEALFRFGQQSRRDLCDFVKVLAADEWDAEKEFKLMNSSLSATPRKIVVHILLHEIRHWAQIATILRFNGLTGNFHDFLFSPVMGGYFRPES